MHYLECLEAILARIESESDNLTLVLADLEELKTQAEPGIRVRIENCMVPLAMLQRAGKQLRSAMIAVLQLDFPRLENMRLELPTLEQCVVNENIATLRKRHKRVFNQILDTAASLRPLIDMLRQAGLDENAALPECVTVFLDPNVMAKVFACDALDRAMPSRLRSEPAGEYDRVLGIEGFFEFIYALPAPYDQSIYAEFQFQPEIVKFRALLSAIRTFRMFSDQKENEWLHAGSFQRLYDKTGEILAERDRIADEYSGREYSEMRGKILADAIVIFLSEGTSSEEKLEAFSREVKNLRNPIIRLVRDYNSAVPEEKIRIRDTISGTRHPRRSGRAQNVGIQKIFEVELWHSGCFRKILSRGRRHGLWFEAYGESGRLPLPSSPGTLHHLGWDGGRRRRPARCGDGRPHIGGGGCGADEASFQHNKICLLGKCGN